MKEAVIVSLARTPMGSFGGVFAGISATDLGAKAIKGAVERVNLDPNLVQEVFMGNVLSANLGQAPARQAAIVAGLSQNVPATTVNKVCSSGMKAVMFAAQSVMLGHNDVVVAGGMESMSNVPYYVPKARFGYKYGSAQIVDGLEKDGLWEVYNNFAMGNCADNTAKEMGISREDQDEYAINSYKRAAAATEAGDFKEIISVEVPQRKGDPLVVKEDEEFRKANFEKFLKLRPAFSKEGTVTAANASTLNDGASALVIMSAEKAQDMGLKPLAKIRGFADAAHDPLWFTTAPSLAMPIAMKRAGVNTADVDFFEVNEAFSAVAIANAKNLELDMSKLNVFGGAVALGHPLGNSGSRILTTLHSVLTKNNGTIGLAGICNGGGGASAMVIERMN